MYSDLKWFQVFDILILPLPLFFRTNSFLQFLSIATHIHTYTANVTLIITSTYQLTAFIAYTRAYKHIQSDTHTHTHTFTYNRFPTLIIRNWKKNNNNRSRFIIAQRKIANAMRIKRMDCAVLWVCVCGLKKIIWKSNIPFVLMCKWYVYASARRFECHIFYTIDSFSFFNRLKDLHTNIIVLVKRFSLPLSLCLFRNCSAACTISLCLFITGMPCENVWAKLAHFSEVIKILVVYPLLHGIRGESIYFSMCSVMIWLSVTPGLVRWDEHGWGQPN